MIQLRHLFALLAGSSLWAQSLVEAKAVFAHYMVCGLDSSTDHAARDIDLAMSMDFDAFALNVGDPTAWWATDAIKQLFDYAATRIAAGKKFGLFFSFDFYACQDFDAFQALYNDYKDSPAYYHFGPNDLPVVSTYSGGDLGPDTWGSFRKDNKVFLIPNAESDSDYYDNSGSFFSRWKDSLDGVFSWETAWPGESETAANVSSTRDETVKKAADAVHKVYMMGLSSLQYKRCCGSSYYRAGEVTLPERMTEILEMKPELTEVLTWNDSGESHYIGNIWEESIDDEVSQYAGSSNYSHHAWQPLIRSFNHAFKAGHDASQMAPAIGKPIGAMWYRAVLTSCSGESPPGAGAAKDAINYAIILPAGSDGYKVRILSNGKVLATNSLQDGLNYGSIPNMSTGQQKLEFLDASGKVVQQAVGKLEVSDSPFNGFCNYNYVTDAMG